MGARTHATRSLLALGPEVRHHLRSSLSWLGRRKGSSSPGFTFNFSHFFTLFHIFITFHFSLFTFHFSCFAFYRQICGRLDSRRVRDADFERARHHRNGQHRQPQQRVRAIVAGWSRSLHRWIYLHLICGVDCACRTVGRKCSSTCTTTRSSTSSLRALPNTPSSPAS
eukprot:SAG31_NODE_3151_length_4615_cov_5.922276_3_plen_168_part_00